MTLLDDIIDASTDSSVATHDLLRKVQVVAHRLGATEIVKWVKQELTGYDTSADLPSYRVVRTNVMGTFSGPFRSFSTHPLTMVPHGLSDRWSVEFREPLGELQAMAQGEGDLYQPWAAMDVERYETSGVFRIEMHGLFSAQNVINRQTLHGLVDIVRSKALEFALDLQDQFPDAGTVGGPTVTSVPALASTVYNITNNITGDGTNVAAGEHVHQRSTVKKGDIEALRREIKALGLASKDTDEFVAAILEEGSLEAPRTKRLLGKVRTGAIALAAGLSTDLAADALIELGKAFLGI